SIARDTGVRLLFSHFVYQYGEGDLDSALEIVDKARDAGLDIHIDSGMYTDWATYIHTATYDLQTIHDNGMHFHDMMVATGPYIGQRLDFELYAKIRNEYPDESIIYCNHLKDEAHRTLRCPYAMPSTDMGAYSPRRRTSADCRHLPQVHKGYGANSRGAEPGRGPQQSDSAACETLCYPREGQDRGGL
ncbi:MAG: hypothetical protein ACLTDS_16070, partial [Bianqueaceae bacterium]